MYASYEYYRIEYGGEKIDNEAAFNRLSRRASGYLDAVCCCRIPKDVPTGVKDACCALCDVYFEETERAHLISEDTDGYIVTYREENADKKAYEAAFDYLYPTGLLYSGVGLQC